MIRNVSSFFVATLMASSYAHAQAERIGHPCASTVDRDARLSCYDKMFPPTPEVLSAEAERSTRAFGARAVPPSSGAPQTLSARILRLDRDARGGRTVTLDNEQVWQLTESTSLGRLVQGDVVTMRSGALGSYMLVTSGGAVLRARRIR